MADLTRFTELLFANQSLDELLTRSNSEKIPLEEKVWRRLAEAAKCLRTAERDRASELLVQIVRRSDIGTRALLWSWTALRDLGVEPEPDDATDIKGVVIQLPMGRGYDVLAAYADGTARYVNHSGKTIVWDLPDVVISRTIHQLLESCKSLTTDVATDLPWNTGSDSVRVTVLTLSGNRFTDISMQSLRDSPINQVLSVGAELMSNLIKRTKTMN